MALTQLLLCCILFSVATASHLQEGTARFWPRGWNPDGTFRVDFRYQESFRTGCHQEFNWQCYSGYCGTINFLEYQEIDNDNNSSRPWCQAEGYAVITQPNDKPFSLRESSCCWVYNVRYAGSWMLHAYIDLGTRSDTWKPNRSPVTAIIPIIRIPQNCATNYKLMAHDPDDDIVNCRYGLSYTSECSSCVQHNGFYFDQATCTLSYFYSGTGKHVFELVLEDFPRQQITLSYRDGTTSIRNAAVSSTSQPYTSPPSIYTTYNYLWWFVPTSAVSPVSAVLSQIPLQFVVEGKVLNNVTQYSYNTNKSVSSRYKVLIHILSYPCYILNCMYGYKVGSTVSSCTWGDYRPAFLPPTPSNGASFSAAVETRFQLRLSATATMDRLSDFKISGPINVTKTVTHDRANNLISATIEWTPTINDLGDRVPMCFVAETTNGYQSELRCVIVTVEVGSRSTGEAEVICTDTTMTLLLLKSSIRGVHENHLRLNDQNCMLTSNASHIIASISLNSCGTEIEETENDIIFKNEITSFDHPHEVITRKHLVEVPFSCSFPKKSNISSAFHPHKGNFVFSEAGFGRFSYSFEFYSSNNYYSIIDPSNYPLNVELQDELYMKIQVESALSNIELFVESCKATPHDDPNDPVYYDILKNGCVEDDTVATYPSNQTEFRFSMEAFAFIGNYEEVYISCTVILCKHGDPNTRCSQGCTNGTSSGHNIGKRSLASETQSHFISQGPLIMKKRSLHENKDYNSNSALNMNTLIVAVAFVASVALIAAVIMYKAKVSHAIKYEALPVNELSPTCK
uniref:ZP domain-containing protein n=1 Tax=Latimeria chalumnae TaxID=7897 RepID=H3ACW8_LATCH